MKVDIKRSTSLDESVNIMQPNCEHQNISWDDFVSLEKDEKDRCTKYIIYGYCPGCHHRFRKYFSLLKSGKVGKKTYVIEEIDFR